MAPSTHAGDITLQKLSSMFHMPEKEVAAKLGMCLTSLKKIARGLGVTRWPYRKLKSLERSIKKLGDDTTTLSSMAKTAIAQCPTPAIAIASPSPVHIAVVEEAEPACRPAEAIVVPDVDGPVCILVNESVVIENWSSLWTVQSIRKYVLTPLGGNKMTFSQDGSSVTLAFTTPIVAMQAKRVIEQACSLIEASAAHTASVSSPSSDGSDDESMDEDASQSVEDIIDEFHDTHGARSGKDTACKLETPQPASAQQVPMTHLPDDIFVTQPASLLAAINAPCSQAHMLYQPGSSLMVADNMMRSSWDMGASGDHWSTCLLSF